ncbi:putative porin [Methylomagnum sp.]
MKANPKILPLALLISGTLASSTAFGADEKEELLKLRNTTLNLIDLLVQQGVLDKQKAGAMIEQAEKKAAAEAKAEARKEAEQAAADTKPSGKGKSADGTVRVTYVPDFVKDEIRAEVAKDLEAKVTKQVKDQAKAEQWGIPAALPEWVSRIHPYGDMRLRYENDFFGDNNQPNSYFNWPYINAKGGLASVDNPYRNTTVDRQRYRMRFRLGLEAEIAEGLKAAVRVTTSNDRNPISINQTLGQYGTQYDIALDRAFLQYDYRDGQGYDWMTLWAGRMPNPWFSSDNMFDPDLNFEGVAGTFRLPFGQDDPALKGYEPVRAQSPTTAGLQQFQTGFTRPNEAFLTLGVFPLQEIELSSHDKWMWAAQTGFDWLFAGDSRLKAGVAYYDYSNTQARRNPLGSTEFDWTAPKFFTQGNSLARISNDLDPATEPRLVGLASRFQVFDALAMYDYSGFDPYHVILTGNYSENFGFNQAQILRNLGENIKPQTRAFQVRLDVGQPNISKFNDWGVWLAYKYLERDAVLDAFTDSNFHLSGTNAKGWMLGVNYGLAKNTWLNLRWLSASTISGPSYDVDVLLADLNARF